MYQLLANAVLLVHVGVVLFVVLGLPLVVIGNRAGWSWVNRRGWRVAHLAAIAVVTLQAWLGRYCPLTIWESALRERAGQEGYTGGFIEHWVHRLLYYDVTLWIFAILYPGVALLVAWSWWRYPPRRDAVSRSSTLQG